MKKALALLALVIGVSALAATAEAAPSRSSYGGKKAVTTGFYRGQTIGYFDFGPIKLQPGNKLAPIWAVTNGAAGQHNVVDTVPGQANYSPLWQVNMVTWKAGVTPRLLSSAAQVKQAEQAGDVTISQTKTVVNCPVLAFGQKRIAGFSNGHAVSSPTCARWRR